MTPRAQAWLDTLPRFPTVPTARVVELLTERGFAALEPWVAFHEQFAGYGEPVAGETAIWGLAQPVEGVWFAPDDVYASHARGAVPASVMCADVHPSHDYLLHGDGTFVGPPFTCASFGIKVERSALSWEFTRDGGARRVYEWNGVRVQDQREALLAELADFEMPEAGDRFARYYLGPDKLLAESLIHGSVKLLVRR